MNEEEVESKPKVRRKIIAIAIIVILMGASIAGYIYVNQKKSWGEPEPVFIVSPFTITDQGDVEHLETSTAFGENYTGLDLSIEFRDELIRKLMLQVGNSGYNNTTLIKAFRCVYKNWSDKPTKIPCYLKYVVYHGELNQIAIAFNRALWVDEQPLDRVDIYVFSAELLAEYTIEECVLFSDIRGNPFPPNPIWHYWGYPDY